MTRRRLLRRHRHQANHRHAATDASVHEPLTRQLVAVDFVSCYVQRCVALDALCEAWPALNDALKTALMHGTSACIRLFCV
jgi:hypothetical protein